MPYVKTGKCTCGARWIHPDYCGIWQLEVGDAPDDMPEVGDAPDDMPEVGDAPDDMPEVGDAPDTFRVNIEAIGGDFDRCRAIVIREIQDGMTWDEARAYVLKSAAFYGFNAAGEPAHLLPR